MTEEDFKALAERRHAALICVQNIGMINVYGKTAVEMAEIDLQRELAKAEFDKLSWEYHCAIVARVASSQKKACEK